MAYMAMAYIVMAPIFMVTDATDQDLRPLSAGHGGAITIYAITTSDPCLLGMEAP